MMRKVRVEMGYASGAEAGALTMGWRGSLSSWSAKAAMAAVVLAVLAAMGVNF